MRCAWQAFLNLLPVWMRKSVDHIGSQTLLEIRLRIGLPPELITVGQSVYLNRTVTNDDIRFCINIASQYSPWAAFTVAKGFLTAQGGHRIGICGQAVSKGENITGIRDVSSVCLRVARDFPGIADKASHITESILIIGRPGCGKTTLLRDLIRQLSCKQAKCISVVDTKAEIFPRANGSFCFPIGDHTDIISGCGKKDGIESVLRNMTPDIIALDEITAEEDAQALLQAGWCGVTLIATAHAGSKSDLFKRPVYKPIIQANLFQILLILHQDRSWHMERIHYDL